MKAYNFILLFVLFVLSSCSMYHPQAVDIPLLTTKGEIKADATFSVAATMIPSTPGINTTISYAATDCIAVQGFADYDGETNHYFQGAIGAFKPFNRFVLEGFAGVGVGYSFHQYDYSTQNRRNEIFGNYNIYFGQVDFGWNNLTAVHIDVGGAIKMGAFCPNFVSIDYNTNDETITSQINYDSPLLLVEPQLFFRLGSESFKVCFKFGFTSLGTNKSKAEFQYEPFNFGLGVNFRF